VKLMVQRFANWVNANEDVVLVRRGRVRAGDESSTVDEQTAISRSSSER